MSELIALKAVFVAGCAAASMIVTVKTSRPRPNSLEKIRNEYAMPRVISYGMAALLGLMALNELGHLIALVRG